MSSKSARALKSQLRGMVKLREALRVMGWTAVQPDPREPGLIIGSRDYCEVVGSLVKEALTPLPPEPISEVKNEEK